MTETIGRKILIGDIHGCLETFRCLLGQMKAHIEQDQLILLGDYIDRGPHSKGVIDEIIQMKQEGWDIISIRGNHEQMLIAGHHAEVVKGWVDMADKELTDSFEISNLTELPSAYIDLCESLPYYYLDNEFIAVHAGINFDRKQPLEHTEDLMWIRDWYGNVDYDWLQGRK
ncbi:MAG: metallophosphoesterase family protein, partial [Bacteroidota bacterium]